VSKLSSSHGIILVPLELSITYAFRKDQFDEVALSTSETGSLGPTFASVLSRVSLKSLLPQFSDVCLSYKPLQALRALRVDDPNSLVSHVHV